MSSIVGSTTSLYKVLCTVSQSNTLSNVNSFLLVVVQMEIEFFEIKSTHNFPSAFFENTFVKYMLLPQPC